jgi:hypothetical protein
MFVRYSVFCNDENKLVQGYTSGEPLTFCPNNVNHTIAANTFDIQRLCISVSIFIREYNSESLVCMNRFWLILYPREDCLQFEIVWRGRVPSPHPPTLRWMYRTRTTRSALDLRNEVGLSAGLTYNASIGVDRRVFDWEPDGTFWTVRRHWRVHIRNQATVSTLSYNVEAWRLLG